MHGSNMRGIDCSSYGESMAQDAGIKGACHALKGVYAEHYNLPPVLVRNEENVKRVGPLRKELTLCRNPLISTASI